MNNNERRNFVRVPLNLEITLKTDNENIATNAYNISEAGFYCSIDKKLEVDTVLDISIMLMPNDAKQEKSLIQCHGKVVRTKENNNIFKTAVNFTDITEENLKNIRDCLTGYTSPF